MQVILKDEILHEKDITWKRYDIKEILKTINYKEKIFKQYITS